MEQDKTYKVVYWWAHLVWSEGVINLGPNKRILE
jgi:hypothetical protein